MHKTEIPSHTLFPLFHILHDNLVRPNSLTWLVLHYLLRTDEDLYVCHGLFLSYVSRRHALEYERPEWLCVRVDLVPPRVDRYDIRRAFRHTPLLDSGSDRWQGEAFIIRDFRLRNGVATADRNLLDGYRQLIRRGIVSGSRVLDACHVPCPVGRQRTMVESGRHEVLR